MSANIQDILNYKNIRLCRINNKDRRYILSITHKSSRLLAKMICGVPYEQFSAADKRESLELKRWFAELHIETELQKKDYK